MTKEPNQPDPAPVAANNPGVTDERACEAPPPPKPVCPYCKSGPCRGWCRD